MRITQEKFKALTSTDNYLFHLHTNYTDGLNSIEDYFRYASKNKFETIVFTEHVRKKISYNFEDYFSEIRRTETKFENVNAIVGVESKIFPDGSIDIPDSILPMIDLLCFACHSFPDDITLYEEAFKEVFVDAKWKSFIRVWVHPGRYLQRIGLTKHNTDIFHGLLNTAVDEGVYIENNLKQVVLLRNIIESIPSESLVVGHDAHSVSELEAHKLMVS
ncbi:MAG: PHP domain-containing protein [Candidatus Scalindua sp.]|nr:PHP domain-containing protein [Candidatus Scalindua sp.]